MRRVTSHDELLERSGGDPWVRWSLDPGLPHEVWVHEDVALVQRVGRRAGFWVAPLRGGMPSPAGPVGRRGEAERVRAALVALRDGGRLEATGAVMVSAPQEHASLAHEVLDLGDGGDWEWMWTAGPPPGRDPREDDLVTLDDTVDVEELLAFSSANNPHVWAEIGTGRVRHWLGLRDDDGHLLAVGGAQLEDSGIPHLAGIVTDHRRRGQRLGTVVSAGLTRWAVEDHGACTLGVFSGNQSALRLYHRLGYRTARAWHSRRLREPASASA